MRKIVNFLCLLLLALISHHTFAQCTLPPNAIFVSPGGTGNGNANSPTNIVSALAIARNNPSRNTILMSGGDHEVGQTLSIPSNVTVEGGYNNNAGVWTKNPAYKTTLKITPPFKYYSMPDIPRDIYTDLHYETVEVASLIGLELDSVQNVKLRDFNIFLWTNGSVYLGTRDGYSVYGIHAYKVKNIEVNNMDITTCNAQNGGQGEDGRNGYSGQWDRPGGGIVNDAATTNMEFPIYKIYETSDARRIGGKGGFGGSVQRYVACSGPACLTSGCMPETPAPRGQSGGSSWTAAGGSGGACGDPCKLDCNYQEYMTTGAAVGTLLQEALGTNTVSSPVAHPGFDGRDGADGASGSLPGRPVEYDRYYVPGFGDRGQHGSGGSGGGGGGAGGIRVLAIPGLPPGAGAAGLPLQIMQVTLMGVELIATAAGGGDAVCGGEVLNLSTRGGHGGGGGEGGQAGAGGGGGGSVYGIYGRTVDNVAVGNVTYNLGEPGTGGRGGYGAAGGSGGFGVDGPPLYSPASFFSNRGGKGGKGGHGGYGGDGAPGADGKRYETFNLISGWYGSGLVLSVDTSKWCTNSIIPIIKNANTSMNVFYNSSSAGITTYINTPTYREVSISAPGEIRIQQSNLSFPNQYQTIFKQVTRLRAVPNFNIPAKICSSDSIQLVPTDTTMPGYRWRIYMGDSLIYETAQMRHTFLPPIKNGNVNYKIVLQSYEACCGWSVPNSKDLQIDMPVNLTLSAPHSTWAYRFCKGDATVEIVLNGLTPSNNNTYPGVVWNTGLQNTNKLYASNNGDYYATYTSPYGCVTQSPHKEIFNILDLPVGPVTVNTPVNLCNSQEVTLFATHPTAWKYNYYIDSITPFPIASNVQYFNYQPYFSYYPSAPDSIFIWVQAVSDQGCKAATRSKAYFVHEKFAPAVRQPFKSYYFATLASNCKAMVDYQIPEGLDNCESYVDVTRISGQASGTEFTAGTHTVVHRLRDLFGNVTNVTTTIEVADRTAPVVSAGVPTITVPAQAGMCGAKVNLFTPTAVDNCQGLVQPTIYRSGNITGDTLFGVGENKIYYTFVDSSGNYSSFVQTVIVTDNVPPAINCSNNYLTFYIKDSDTTKFVFYNAPTYSDNCDTFQRYATFVSGFGQAGIRSLGTTQEVYTATDYAGNTSTCTLYVTLTDSIKPVITCPSVSFLTDPGKSYTTVTYPTPTAIDNLPGNISIQWQFLGKYSGDTAGIGTHFATYKATDAYGNSATCDVEIIVSDREGPNLVCPNNINVNNDNGACSAIVNYTVAPAFDNDNSYYTPSMFTGLPSGAAFPLGTTNVVYRVADAQNNRSYCSFDVTVVDNVAPHFTTPCPSDTTINYIPSLCTAQMQLPVLIGADNTCVAPYGGFVSGSLYGYFPMGTTTQVYRIWDVAGNETTCTYNVTVVDNNVLTATCPNNNMLLASPGECTAYASNAGKPIVTPAYGCDTSWWSNNYPAPYWPVGTTTVTYYVRANNQQASCQFSVTVVDNQWPTINDVPNIVEQVTPGACGKIVNFTAPVGADNCPNGSGTYRITGLASGSFFPIGTTVQTYVVSDLANHADTTIFTITIQDTVKPTITVPSNITTNSNQMCGTVVSFVEPVANDNSGCVAIRRVKGYAAGETFPLGTTTQMYVSIDSAGNVDTATFTVTVTPNYPLESSCTDNFLQADPNGNGMVVYYPVPGTVDQWTGQLYPCPNVQIILEEGKPSGAFFPTGRTENHFAFIVKGTGDTVRCQTNVIVTEFNPPMIDCGPTQVYEVRPDSGVCSATFSVPDPTYNDGPSGGQVTLIRQIDGQVDTTVNTVFTPGFHTVQYRAVDYSSNSAYCTVYVNVIDDVKINNPFQNIRYCENAVVDIDPQISGAAEGLTYEWMTTDENYNYIVKSTSKVLHFDELKFSDRKQYNLRVYDRCGNMTMGSEFVLNVDTAPLTTLTGLNSRYCTYDTTDITVSFSPTGGVLSGNGVVGTNKFNPRAAGKGRHIINYSYYDATSGCTGISRDTVDVFDIPATSRFADSIYCVNATPIQLPATNSTYTGAGISGTMFNPAVAGGGNHPVTLTYTENGCIAKRTQTIVVNTLIPNPNITAPASVCEASGNYPLTVATPGGAWQGAALIIDSTGNNVRFDSRAAFMGIDTIIYTVTVNACTASDTVMINVKDKSYNLPYTAPEYCVDAPPVTFDPVDKVYMGLGFTNNVFTPSAVGYRGLIFYGVITTNANACTDTVFRLIYLRGGQLSVNNEQHVCAPGDPLTINLGAGYDSIRWWNGTTESIKTFTDTGRYTVFLRDTAGCEGYDTLHISPYIAPTNIAPITAYACPNDSAIITADSTFTHYAWSTGATTNSITAQPGTYGLTVTAVWGCNYASPPITVTTGPDAIAPTITCPSDSTYFVVAGSCSIDSIYLGTPIALDNCGLNTVTNNAPSTYSVGVNNVTWTARDMGNNTATCVQKITVNDSIAPYFTTTPDNYLVADSNGIGCSAIVPDFTNLFAASDSCAGNVSITQNPTAGTIISTGETPVAIIATDASGNTFTNYMLFFTQDTVGPNLVCPSNLTGTAVGTQTTAVVNYTVPTQAINCTNTTVQRIAGLGSGAAFPIGVTTERYVVTDANGATDTCSFTVTVDHVTGIVHSNGDGNLLKVMPVPATDRLTVVFESSTTTMLQVRLLNIAGQAIYSEDLKEFNGTYNHTIDIASQGAGTYILELLTDSELITRKIVKL